MKKRLLIVFSVLCMVCLCVGLAACNLLGNNSNGGSGGTKKTLKSVTVEVADGSSYARYFADGEFTLPEGVSADFSKRDFVVKGVYSDKSTSKLTDYTIETKAEGDGYVIEFAVGEEVKYTINVKRAASSLQTLSALSETGPSYEYSGSEFNILNDVRFADESTLYRAIVERKVEVEEGSVIEATDAGEYSFVAKACSGYAWTVDGNETTSITVSWTIRKKAIAIPTVNFTGNYYYNGEEKTLSLDMHGFGNYITFEDGGSETNKATNVGTYSCRARIKSEYQKNYVFAGDHTSTETVDVATWTILPRALPVPTVVGAEKGQDGFYHYTYTGSAILPELTVGNVTLTLGYENGAAVYTDETIYPTEKVSITINSLDVEDVNAGSGQAYLDDADHTRYHTVSYSIVNDSLGNYVFAGGENSGEIRFVIDKATTSLPADFTQQFALKYVYTGEECAIGGNALQLSENDYLTLLADESAYSDDITLATGFMATDAVLAYLTEQGISGDELSWAADASFGDDDIATIGSKALAIVYKKGASAVLPEGNYEPVSATIEVEVIKNAMIYVYYDSPSVAREDGKVDRIYSLNKAGQTMSFVFSASLSSNSESIPSVVTHKFSRTENGVYAATSDLTQAGYYKTEITVQYDDAHYTAIFEENNTFSVKDTVEYPWSIAKREFGINTKYTISGDEANGTVNYDAGAHYRDFFPEDNGNGYDIDITVQCDIAVYYKANESDNYTVLVKDGQGKYDLSTPGYYKAVVTVTYDADNFVLENGEDGDVFDKEWIKEQQQP